MKKTSKEEAPGSTERLTKKRNNKHAVHYKSATDEWASPKWLFILLNKLFDGGFTCDPCSTDLNAKCLKHYTLIDNGLLKSWANEVVWLNPPYGRMIWEWMRKAYQSVISDGATVVCLVPARTDTRWWHDFVMQENNQIVFLKGRLKFGDAKNSAPFPSAIVVMRPSGVTQFAEGHLSRLINDAKAGQGKHAVDSSRAA
jgi:site-specific DNA-methyltransferase (adenine-specific)